MSASAVDTSTGWAGGPQKRNIVQRPESGEGSPLEHALGIPGADAVALIAAESRSLTWWAGSREPDDDEAAAVVLLARAAQGMVGLADPDDDLGDVLVTSGAAFHVLRMVRPESGEPQVAHLTLRRGGANLAMARHEFKVLAERYVDEAGGPPPPPPPVAARRPVHLEPVPPLHREPVIAEAGAPLPRRRPANGAPVAAGLDNDTAVSGNWFTLFGQPFTADEAVLERVLGTLRHL
jgi:hypothetical protein